MAMTPPVHHNMFSSDLCGKKQDLLKINVSLLRWFYGVKS